MRRTIGIVMMIVFISIPLLASIGYDVYWLIECLKKGGDWKYYASKLLGYGFVIGFGIAFALIVL